MAINKTVLVAVGIFALFAVGAFAVMNTNENNDVSVIDADRTFNAESSIASALAEVPAAKAIKETKTIIGERFVEPAPAVKNALIPGVTLSTPTPSIKTIEDARTYYHGIFAKAVSKLETLHVSEENIVKFVNILAEERESGVKYGGNMCPMWFIATMDNAMFAYDAFVSVFTMPFDDALSEMNIKMKNIDIGDIVVTAAIDGRPIDIVYAALPELG